MYPRLEAAILRRVKPHGADDVSITRRKVDGAIVVSITGPRDTFNCEAVDGAWGLSVGDAPAPLLDSFACEYNSRTGIGVQSWAEFNVDGRDARRLRVTS